MRLLSRPAAKATTNKTIEPHAPAAKSLVGRAHALLRSDREQATKAAAAGVAGPDPGEVHPGGRSSLFYSLPATAFDYEREAGPLWKNSIVLAVILARCRMFVQAPASVIVEEDDGEQEYDTKHPLVQLLRRPNRFWSRSQLWSATILSLDVAGNSYWIKAKDATGKPKELWWTPHWMMKPRWPVNGSEFISHYEYYVDGRTYRYEVEDVVHLVSATRDPENSRLGLTQFGAALRSVCTDNEAENFSATILRNMGMPGAIATPDSDKWEIDDDSADVIEARWQQMTTGDNRGRLLTLTNPVKLQTFGANPEQMVLDIVRRIPEERVSAIAGFPALVAGLGAGLDRATYNNVEGLIRLAWENNLIPTGTDIGEQLDVQLGPDFGLSPDQRIGFDYRRVKALQEDRDKASARGRLDWLSGLAKLNEAKSQAGYKPEPGDLGDRYIWELGIKPGAANASGTVRPDDLAGVDPTAAPGAPAEGPGGQGADDEPADGQPDALSGEGANKPAAEGKKEIVRLPRGSWAFWLDPRSEQAMMDEWKSRRALAAEQQEQEQAA